MRTGTARRLAMAAGLASAACLGVTLLPTGEAVAQTYACGDPSSGHCYGTASWQEKPQYFGAYADIQQAPMGCPSGCGGFVDDEI